MFATSQGWAASRNTKFVCVGFRTKNWINSKVKIFSLKKGEKYSPLEGISLDLTFEMEIISQTRVILW